MKKISLTLVLMLVLIVLSFPAFAAQVRATGNVNVRTGPGLDYGTIETIFEGNSLEYTGQTEYDDRGVAWYSVDCYGQAGWMSSRYSQLEGDTSEQSNDGASRTGDTSGRIELVDYMGKDGEWAANALGLHYQKDCYMDNADSINLYDEYGGNVVMMIGIFENNDRHCVEGVYPGMNFSKAESTLISRGYSESEEENNGSIERIYKKGVYSISITQDGANVLGIYIDAFASLDAKSAGTQTSSDETSSSGTELSGYYRKNIHDAAAEIGSLSYYEYDGEDGIKDVYENSIIRVCGWDTVAFIQLIEKSDYTLCGIKVGMSREAIREKMGAYPTWGDGDDEFGVEYIVEGNRNNPETLLGVSYDDNGYAYQVEYGIWS